MPDDHFLDAPILPQIAIALPEKSYDDTIFEVTKSDDCGGKSERFFDIRHDFSENGFVEDKVADRFDQLLFPF